MVIKVSMTILLTALLTGCSTLTDFLMSSVVPSKGVDATAQVGAENSKGAIVAKADLSSASKNTSAVDIGDVTGESSIDASQIFNSNINLPTYAVFLIAFGFWMVRTPLGMLSDFCKARRRHKQPP